MILANDKITLSIDEIRPHLLVHLSESDLIKLILEISEKFTKNRDQINDYVMEHRHVSAYASFYLSTNIPKLHFLLSHLSSSIVEDFTNRPFIDMGTGPGTFSLGWKRLLNIPGHVEMIGVDSSQIMLDQATKIMSGFFPNDKFITTRKFREKKANSILFFGHSINEMGIDRAQDLIMTIDPEYVMWIEPGTSEFFTQLVKLRKCLVENYDVLYPCGSNEECPSNWCHQVLRNTHHQSVERISQLVSLDRKVQPMAAHVYRRKNKTSHASTFATVIRYIQETKFSFEYEICHFIEGKNENVVIEILKKDLSKVELKNLKNSNVGDRYNFEILKMIGKKWRVRLTAK